MNVYFFVSDEPLSKPQQRELALRLLDFALEQEFGLKRETLGKIVRSKHGKPYFAKRLSQNASANIPCFNYSHCEYGAACAVAMQEVGVDIQNIKQVRPSVAKRVCCDNELRIIKTNEDFIRIWTQKEAFAKYTGNGLTEGFARIDTTAFSGNSTFKQGNCYIAWEPQCDITPVAMPQSEQGEQL